MNMRLSRGAVLASLVACLPALALAAPGAAHDAKAQPGRADGHYAIAYAEYFTTGDVELGRTVYFLDRGNKQLDGDFVPGLALDGTDAVSYYVDDSRPTADVSAAVSHAAINRGMATWDAQTCSALGMFEVPYDGRATGFVAFVYGYGGSMDYVADVLHAGWLPGAFFNLLAPGGSSYILGATFTIIFTDDDGNPVDTDRNGKYDVAWRETYYNDAFTWKDGATFDIETIALHEAGHGLSQAHFGTAFRDAGGGQLHFAPRAVMNAAYSGVQTTLTATDNAGHCSNWAQWPKE